MSIERTRAVTSRAVTLGLLLFGGLWAPGRHLSLAQDMAATASELDADSPDEWWPQKPEFMRIADELYSGRNRYLGRAPIDQFRQRLGSMSLSPQERLQAMVGLTLQLLKTGEVDAAIAEVENAMTVARRTLDPDSWAPLHRLRALVYLRQAEVQNCIVRHNADCCIFPLAGGGIHVERGPAENAKTSYEAMLRLKPDDLKARWLLNVAYMMLGKYPDGVPEKYLIPKSAFASEYDIGLFPDIAPQLGLHTFNLCGGAIMEDFDNDGYLDIVTSTYDPRGQLSFYRNLGNGRFEDRSTSSRADDQLGGLNCLAADYNNDGYRDVLILRGAWLFDDGQIRNSLLRNNVDGTFTDVTRHAGLAEPARPTQTAVWGDFDNDGDLDLYIGNESRAQWEELAVGDYPSQMFRNNGDGTFTDIAAEAGVTNDRYAKGVTAGDYDNDGDLDLYVSNIGTNRLYRNNGDFTFTDVTAEAGVSEPQDRSFVPWFFDYDNDGWLDLFVGAYRASIADLAADALGQPHEGVRPRLYRNRGDGTFAEVAIQLGLDHPYLPMGANFGDLDNDGFLDIYLGTGEPDLRTLMPNIMLRNDQARRFQDVTTSGGFGHLQKGHGMAFGDIDNDGDQDIYHQLGGFYPGDKFANALFQNPGHGNRFIFIKLVGRQSNRDGIGARIRVIVDTEDGPREFHRAVGSVSSFGGSPIRQEIGLGQSTSITRLEVTWPKSNLHQVFENVEMDGLVRIVEGQPELQRVDLTAIEF
ncbi:MAG: CRTAC1 family protein [Phycisphaerales bacterium]